MSQPMDYPEQRLMWPGAILASIAHAISRHRFPNLGHEQSWDGENYNVQNSSGARGTISFSDNKFVGVFFNENSDRNPFRSKTKTELTFYLEGMSPELERLANDEALQYMLEEVNGMPCLVITSAFWGDSKNQFINAAEPWPHVLSNGAFLVKNQLLETASALKIWQAELNLTPEEIMMVKSLFEQKLITHPKAIQLDASTRNRLQQMLKNSGIVECQASLSEIGIHF